MASATLFSYAGVQSKGKVNLRQVESKQVKVVTMDFE